jgi:hypothetical protein
MRGGESSQIEETKTETVFGGRWLDRDDPGKSQESGKVKEIGNHDLNT